MDSLLCMQRTAWIDAIAQYALCCMDQNIATFTVTMIIIVNGGKSFEVLGCTLSGIACSGASTSSVGQA